MERLPRSFFEDHTPLVARRLLGQLLVRRVGGKTLSGVIVEVEAYRGRDDPASHAYRGETARNRVMFGEAGHAYVYFSYGFHWCLNITTEAIGVPGAVLVRGLEPLDGVPMMRVNRKKDDMMELTNGPGKLTQALRIDKTLNGEDLIKSKRLFLARGESESINVGSSSRIGIRSGLEYRWRYFIGGNQFVSRAKPIYLARSLSRRTENS